MVGGQLVVYATYKPYYDETKDAEAILGTFSTTDAAHSRLNGFINEFVGSFLLFLGGASILTHAPYFETNNAAVFIALGFLVMTLVASLGGATGPALNPARDLGLELFMHYCQFLIKRTPIGGVMPLFRWWLLSWQVFAQSNWEKYFSVSI